MKYTKLMISAMVFVLPVLAMFYISYLLHDIKEIEQHVESISHNMSHHIISEIGKRAELLSTMNRSATKLARVLNSSLFGVNVSFGIIQDRVCPILFQAILTIPLVSQVSYTGLDNLYFSYQYKDDGLRAVYINSSEYTNISYAQQVNPEDGKLYGEATILTKRGDIQDFNFNQIADVPRKGLVSLAFPVNTVAGFFSEMELYGGYFCLVSREGKIILEENPNMCFVLKCYSGKPSRGDTVKIQGSSYRLFSSALDILGMQSTYTLALPLEIRNGHRKANIALIFVILTTIVMIILFFFFVFVYYEALGKKIRLRSSLIKQMEATQRAETKNSNKSHAFASANHDVRGSLAGITGLTEISQTLVEPDSELGTNLKQIKDCANDLMGILNTILDNSKIEAGKMQLEEVEFDITELVEDVVDLYHPMGSKKGVDVILDIQNGLLLSNYSKVRGDRTKVRQILSNLVSNAVKCTNEGHVVVRGWAKKPSSKTPLFSSVRQSKTFGFNSCFRSREIYNEQSENRTLDMLEFVFEVDDTGPGIPKEKQKSIFENYVQIKNKDEPEPQAGTGLGLGIVQALVRLMHGEIKIKDKKVGEKGTCFKFNIFLGKSELDLPNETRRANDSESQREYSSSDSIRNSSPLPSAFSPKQVGSHVVLFIQGEKRRRVARKFMERIGVQVSIVNEWKHLSHTLNKVKKEMFRRKGSVSSLSDLSLSSEDKSVPLSSMDGADEMSHYSYGRPKSGNVSNFVLIIIDTSGGPLTEFSKAVGEFRRGLQNNCCRIIWVDKPGAQNMMHSKGLDEKKLPLTDLIISKPFHGSRLSRVVELLPEFGGSKRRRSKKQESPNLPYGSRSATNENRSVLGSKGKETASLKITADDKILSGKKILVVDDNAVQRKIASTAILKLGAIVDLCENGEEAVQLVSKGLSDAKKQMVTALSLPYDYIFMDCEMPVMDGFEATKTIRAEEGFYGIHIPIIALSAHTTGEEASRMRQNGIDFFVTKPLNKDKLLDAILRVDDSRN